MTPHHHLDRLNVYTSSQFIHAIGTYPLNVICWFQGADAEQKKEVLDWVEAVIKDKVPRDQPFEKVLKDGVILCQ